MRGLRRVYTFFIRMPTLLLSINFLNFSDFKPGIILKVFFNTKTVTSSQSLRKISQSLLMFDYIIKLSKGFYFVSIMQKYI